MRSALGKKTKVGPSMKPAVEWLNEIGETVATSMFSGKKPPGVEVEELIVRIQDDARLGLVAQAAVSIDAACANRDKKIAELTEEAERLRDAASTLIRHKNTA